MAQSPIYICDQFFLDSGVIKEFRVFSMTCVTLWHKVQFMIVACLREYGVMTAGWLLVSLECISMVVVLYGTKSDIYL